MICMWKLIFSKIYQNHLFWEEEHYNLLYIVYTYDYQAEYKNEFEAIMKNGSQAKLEKKKAL